MKGFWFWLALLAGFQFGIVCTLFVQAVRKASKLTRSGRHAEAMARHLHKVGPLGERGDSTYGTQR